MSGETTTKRTNGRAVPAPQTAEQATITPATLWRRAAKDGELYTLPGSGFVVRLRRPSLYALAARGVDAAPMTREVMRLLALAERPQTEDERIAAFLANAAGYVEVARLAFVEPRIAAEGQAPNYDAGEIDAADLSDRDLVWIFYDFLEGGAGDRERFRVG